MTLLFDENLSPRLVQGLSSDWPGSTHVEHIGMRGASDQAIWTYAQSHGLIIVSKDDDFRSLALVRGPPPKVIGLEVGNASTAVVANLLRENFLLLKVFSLAPMEAFLSLVR